MNNTKQLTLGWIMYAGDNNDRTANLLDNGSLGGTPAIWATNWVGGLMNSILLATNTQTLSAGELFQYINNINSYHCPADNSTQYYPLGSGGTRVRSYSMSEVFGEGEWLTPSTPPLPNLYKTYSKVGNIIDPTDTWLLLDEAPGSINDAAFAVEMMTPGKTSVTEIDHPAGYHGNACGMSFSDGHSVVHKWESTLTTTAIETTAGSTAGPTSSSDPAFITDILWLSSVTTVHN
jgi:hypothetical protein